MTTLKTITMAILAIPTGILAGLALVVGYAAALLICLACGIEDWKNGRLEGYDNE